MVSRLCGGSIEPGEDDPDLSAEWARVRLCDYNRPHSPTEACGVRERF